MGMFKRWVAKTARYTWNWLFLLQEIRHKRIGAPAIHNVRGVNRSSGCAQDIDNGAVPARAFVDALRYIEIIQ
jgi:hypothetical protein